MKKAKNNNVISYIVISLVAILAVGYMAVAFSGNISGNNFEGDCIDCILEAPEVQQPSPVVEEVVLGGTIGSNIYQDVVFHGLTQITRPDSSINVPLILRPSTTHPVLNGIAAQYYNESADDLLCNGNTLMVDFYSAVTGFGSTYSVGTTTRSDGLYLTATTSATLIGNTYVGTTTEGILTTQIGNSLAGSYIAVTSLGTYFNDIANGAIGVATGTNPFILRSSEVLVVAYDFSGATSTEHWTSGSYDAGTTVTRPGRLHVDCINRRGNNLI